MQILSQPAMVNWLQSRFVESHIRVGNYNNVAFVFYIYNLFTVISQNPFIKGIDLDIEEPVSLVNVQKVIRDLKTKYGSDFIITMAPVCNSLIYNYPGLGGFIYRDLMNTDEGKLIDWFNGQFYFQYSILYEQRRYCF